MLWWYMPLYIVHSATAIRSVGTGRAVLRFVPWTCELGRDSGTCWEPRGSMERSRCVGVQVPCGPGSHWLLHLRIRGAASREGDTHPAGGQGPSPLPGAGSSSWLSLWWLQYAALAYWLLHHTRVGVAAQEQLPREQEHTVADPNKEA